MKASEFINTFAFATIFNAASNYRSKRVSMDEMKKVYAEQYFYLPRIVCKDGFSISIQVHNGNYCASENGTRQFGFNWLEVEWGYPTENIDAKKYNAELWDDDQDTTNTVGGYVDINLIDSLVEEHGGLDIDATLKNPSLYSNE